MNNNDEDFEEVVLDAFSYIVIATIVLFIIIIGGISIYNNYIKDDNTISKNIIEHVDSIKKENDKLIIEVNNLDSIKNAEIIEVKNLKLFYKLIRE